MDSPYQEYPSTLEVTRNHTQFFDLPIELRIEIWELALPEARVLRMAFEPLDNDTKEYHAYSMGPAPIPTVLHICHESREIAKQTLRLGFGETTHPDDKEWWNPSIDTCYLPLWQPPSDLDLSVTYEFVDDSSSMDVGWTGWDFQHIWEASRQKSIAAVRHIAVPWLEPLLEDFGLFEGQEWGIQSVGPEWLAGFPALKSVSFLVDHYPLWYRAGDIVLYEPLHGTDEEIGGEPRVFEKGIMASLEDYRAEKKPEWKTPSVEIMIMGNLKTFRLSGFCLPGSKVKIPKRKVIECDTDVSMVGGY